MLTTILLLLLCSLWLHFTAFHMANQLYRFSEPDPDETLMLAWMWVQVTLIVVDILLVLRLFGAPFAPL